VRQIGTNGIPALLKMLARKDSLAVAKLVDFWSRYPNSVSAWAGDPSWYRNQAAIVNNDAALGFEILGADAQQAVPALIRLYEQNISPSSQAAISRVLNAMGPEAQRTAIPIFVRAAGSSDAAERDVAIWALFSVDAEHADRQLV